MRRSIALLFSNIFEMSLQSFCFGLMTFSTVSLGIAQPTSSQLEFDGFKARMALEAGHLVRGEFRRAGDNAFPLHFVALNRNIVFLDQTASLGETWKFDAGLMGVLWWPFTPESGPPATRTIRVDPRVSILKARRFFGDGEDKPFLDVGYFPYKYNRDASNLGEYLYRSGTYPGVISTTDGYQLMSNPVYYAYGTRFRFSNFYGKITHDLNLFVETVTDPIGDITPAYETALNLPFVELGFGAAYNRGISFKPGATRPKDDANAYIEYSGDPALGLPYYRGPFLGAPEKLQGDTSIPFTVLHRWTQQGLKLMGRIAFNLGSVIPEDKRGPDDLRIFAEAAVLGWKNQPYFYANRSRRIPIMFGLNVPTLKTLDILSLQFEHYNSLFNDTYFFNFNSLPIWKVDDYQTMDQQFYQHNPWRWSVFGKKRLNRIASMDFQVASDHLRLRDLLTSQTEYEMTLNPTNWYYLMRMDIGI